jgi:glycogen operon protein
MQLNIAGDQVLVWFNRKAEAQDARLPEGEWSVGLVSDDQAEVTVAEGKTVLPPRSVLALVRPPEGQVDSNPQE